MSTTTGERPGEVIACAHDALLYRSADEYVEGVLPFLTGGTRAGVPTLVAVPESRGALLRAALGDEAGDVEFADMAAVGRNPGCIIPVVRGFVADHPRRRVRFVGEPIWPGRSAAEIGEGIRHEALLNVAFAGVPIDILCPYDAGGLEPEVLSDAWRTHPTMIEAGARRPSPRYADPAAVYAECSTLPPSPPNAEVLSVGLAGLADLRHRVQRSATAHGVSTDRVDDLLLAVNEVAANILTHSTSGGGTCRVWPDGEGLVCEFRDDGHIDDPLAGRHVPADDAERGRGLWMVNQLCDLVQLHSHQGGTTLRLHVAA